MQATDIITVMRSSRKHCLLTTSVGVESQAERDAAFDALHEEWAPRALAKILELRGFYIKVGQMAASNVGNAFPELWVRTMEVLQDRVPHKDMATVRAVVEASYGTKEAPSRAVASSSREEMGVYEVAGCRLTARCVAVPRPAAGGGLCDVRKLARRRRVHRPGARGPGVKMQ